jgi:hypothetical protein
LEGVCFNLGITWGFILPVQSTTQIDQNPARLLDQSP